MTGAGKRRNTHTQTTCQLAAEFADQQDVPCCAALCYEESQHSKSLASLRNSFLHLGAHAKVMALCGLNAVICQK